MNQLQRNRLRAAFKDYLPLPATMEPHLKQALSRVLDNPGSLTRPEIVLEVAVAYGVAQTAALDLAIALEYFHTASLLFDDLPAMDDAMERRGAPCVHLDFGDSGAILAALALVNRAYFLTWKAVAQAAAQNHLQAIDYIEQQLGVHGLLNGQSMDLHFASSPQDSTTTERTAIGKTVSLIRLTLVLPAIIGGASAAELQLLDRIALFWGLSYQIVDDLKDVLQSTSQSGKTASRDLALGRPNLPLALGVPAATRRLERLINLGDRALDRLVTTRPGLQFLAALRSELGAEATEILQSAMLQPAGAQA